MADTNQPSKKAAPVLSLAPDTGKPTIERGRRKNATWEANNAAIRDAYVRLIADLKRRPTIDEVCQMLGEGSLNSETVRKHINALKFEPIAHPLRILSDDVLLAVIESAKGGNAASQKLWFQVMEGWRESNIVEAQVDHTVSDTKFSVKVHKAGTKKDE